MGDLPKNVDALTDGLSQLTRALGKMDISYAEIGRRVGAAHAAAAIVQAALNSKEQSRPGDDVINQLHSFSAVIRLVCDGLRSGRMAWPEAESHLVEACSLADDLERQLAPLLRNREDRP